MAKVMQQTAAGWTGFSCKKCGAPLTVQRSPDAAKPGERADRGWRVTCTCCGMTEYYEPGTPMLRITGAR